jgi:hypothetical protein
METEMTQSKSDKHIRVNSDLYTSLTAVAEIQKRTIKGLCELLLERGLKEEQKKIELYMEEND